MVAYAEKRFFEWYEDDLSVSLRASGGSYGGGSEVLIVLESNQNHATARDTEVCTTLPASMGEGGGYVPMIVVNRRFADIRVQDTEISTTLEGGSGDGGNNLPMIVEAVCLDNHPNDSRVTLREDNIVQSLTSRCGTGGGNVPMVLINNNGE